MDAIRTSALRGRRVPHHIDERHAAGIKASLKEHLILLEALQCEVIERTPKAFYYLARPTFVTDEGGGSKWIAPAAPPSAIGATIPKASGSAMKAITIAR